MICRHERQIQSNRLQMQNFNVHLISVNCLNRRFGQIVRIFNVDSLIMFFLNFNTTCTHEVVNGEQKILVELSC